MKSLFAALALAGLLAGCAAQTVTPIQEMSEDRISVAYVGDLADAGDAADVAGDYCATPRQVGRSDLDGSMLDGTVVHYDC